MGGERNWSWKIQHAFISEQITLMPPFLITSTITPLMLSRHLSVRMACWHTRSFSCLTLSLSHLVEYIHLCPTFQKQLRNIGAIGLSNNMKCSLQSLLDKWHNNLSNSSVTKVCHVQLFFSQARHDRKSFTEIIQVCVGKTIIHEKIFQLKWM